MQDPNNKSFAIGPKRIIEIVEIVESTPPGIKEVIFDHPFKLEFVGGTDEYYKVGDRWLITFEKVP